MTEISDEEDIVICENCDLVIAEDDFHLTDDGVLLCGECMKACFPKTVQK